MAFKCHPDPTEIRITLDGNLWCALRGEDPQTCEVGIGSLPEVALANLLQIAYPETKSCGEICETGPATILMVLNNSSIGDKMEDNSDKNTRLTHRQKMDQVIDGLDYLTTQEVDALISTIEAFKVREEVSIPLEEPGVCELPGITFRVKDVSRVLVTNLPDSLPGLSIVFTNGVSYLSYFETEEDRDAALKKVSSLMSSIPATSSQ